MPSPPNREEPIFNAARRIADAAARAAWLRQACGDDEALRTRVEALLAVYDQERSFLEPAAAPAPTIVLPRIAEGPGAQIGPYKLLEQIGEGGFGVVFMAEQERPVRRRVALKIIKPGMDTRDVIARFEAERQALAIMDHPNIARVLDAGATESGRPYFVMELVKGIPITEYCDRYNVAPRERLELFATVCQAVQHAHQKGVIHRDIKPSNVLVTLQDGRAVPKVIDFGLAKAMHQRLTDKTLFTQFAQMLGTPLYMSPEQAEYSGLDIDTRSDVYSLGAMLYELLTGSTPFMRQRLRDAALDEILRIIREEDPPRPSLRLSSMGDKLPGIAAHRHIEPKKLGALLRGELDWIVMKALEKDRTRRYETANGFAADILRYLNDEPVTACPPSAAYRFRKFARRNKRVLTATTVVVVALVAGTVVSTWQAVRATHEAQRASKAEGLARTRLVAETQARNDAVAAREEAEKQRIRAEDNLRIAEEQRKLAQTKEAEARQQKTRAEDALVQVDEQRRRAEANFDKARRAVDEYLSQVTENELLTVPGLQPLREELLEAALKFYTEFTQERADDPTLQRELASAHYRLGRIHSELANADAARAANEQAIRLYERLRDRGHFDREMQVALARACYFAPRYDETVTLCQAILEAEPGHAEARSLLADTYNALAIVDSGKNDIEAALKHHRQAFGLREALVRDDPENPRYLAQLGGSVNNLGVLLSKQGKSEEALVMYDRAVEYSALAYERAPQSILWGGWLCTGLRNAASHQAALGQQQKALASYQRLVAISRKRAFENPALTSLRGDLSKAHQYLAQYQQQLGNTAEATRAFREAREVLENIPRETPDQLYELATVYAALAQPAEGVIERGPEEASERQRNIDLTLDTLRKAVDAGYTSVQPLKTDRLFDVIRDRSEFQQIVATLEQAAQAQQLASRSQGNPAQELADRRRAVDLLEGLDQGAPGALRHRGTLAATLQSIGEIQLGLKQLTDAEKSLKEALTLRQDLLTAQPDDPRARLDVLMTQSAIGQLLLDSGRAREGHRLWQDLLAQCRQTATDPADRAKLQSEIASLEWRIAQKYGEIGLWELAGHAVDQSLKTGELSNPYWDCRGAHLLAAQGRLEEHRRFCQLLADKWGKNDAAHVLWAVTMNPQPGVEIKQLLELAETVLKSNPEPMQRFQVATAWYRAGEYERALQLMLPFREKITTGGSAYLHWFAMVYHKLGRQEEAARDFEEAEARYLSFVNRCLQAPESSAVKVGHGGYWYAMAEDQAMRRAAWSEIHGEADLKDPWQHLIQARGYRLIGEIEKADQELAAAAAATNDDADVWMARARLLAQWDDQQRSAEADWQKAVDLAGDDPRPWIHRGRWYAELGQHDKADADFAKAAALTPHDLNKFLEAGWWVAGPYPPELDEFCPPELDPDPSRPVYTIDPKTGLSEEPVAWRTLPTDETGQVDLRPAFNADQFSAYALGIIYSPEERTATLLVGGDDRVRVWLNGQVVRESAPASRERWGGDRVPVLLRRGRNVVLAKIRQYTGTHFLRLRVADGALDRAFAFAELGLWDDAAQQVRQADPQSIRDAWLAARVAQMLLASGDVEGYRRHCAWVLQEFESTTSALDACNVAWACTLAPDVAPDTARLIQLAEQGIDPNPTERYRTGIVARALYRAGRFDDAIARLGEISDLQNPVSDLVLAMAHHQRGDANQARASLAKAQAWYDAATRDTLAAPHYKRLHWNWWELADFQVLYREARRLIVGSAAVEDEKAAKLLTRVREQPRDPLTADFDEVLMINPSQARHWLARGRRLAELGRFDEAESDFDKAFELAPGDTAVATARAAFLAARGDVPRAAEAFLSALQGANATDWSNHGRAVERELARHGEVLDELLRRHPQDSGLHRIRGESLARQARWQESRQSYSSGTPYWSHESCNAALSRLLEDEAGYEQACRRQPNLLTQFGNNPELSGIRQVEIRGLRPVDAAESSELLRLVEQASALAPLSRDKSFAMGLALYRAGKYAEAIDSLNTALEPHSDWQRDATVWPVLAMAHWQLGRQDESRKWLARSKTWIDLTHGAAEIPLSVGPHSTVYDRWLFAHVLHFEAKALIDGPGSAHDALELLAKRGVEQDEAVRARAEALRQERLAQAEAAWQRAVELAGDDPLPWIHRGRWYAECGEHEKADSDFARAASLTPNELNKFLEAGWWVVGPYPANLKEFCPPEVDPDPSRPVHVVDPERGLSEAPEAWRSVATERWGRVDLKDFAGRKDKASVYALACVHSPQEQSRLLMIRKTQPLRVWINGELVEDYTPGEHPIQPHYEQYHRVPVVLRAGRNSILVKAATADFTVRIGDSPRDRAVLLAEQERFTETLAAHAAMTDADRDDQSGAVPHTLYHVVSLLGTDEQYTAACRTLFARAQRGDVGTRFTIAYICAHRPNPVFDEHAATLVASVDELVAQQQADWAVTYGALVHYRAGNRERSLALLNQSASRTWYGLPLQALLAQASGDETAARRHLDEAFAVGKACEASLTEYNRSAFYGKSHFFWWYDWAPFLTHLREAEQTILGATSQADALRMRCEAKSREKWVALPETAAFDHAILFGSIDGAGQPKFPQPYLARGRRLAELDHFDEAEADFNKAVELAPNDADVLAARAVFLADAGQPDRAAADFHAALNLFDDAGPKPRWGWGVPIDLDAAQHDEAFDKLAALRPRDEWLWAVRAAVLMRNGNLDGANAAAQRLTQFGQSPVRAAVALLRGDRMDFTRRSASKHEDIPLFQTILLTLEPVEEPQTAELLAAALRLEQELPSAGGAEYYARFWMAVAKLRAGNERDAVEELEDLLRNHEAVWVRAMCWPMLAIAHHQLGKPELARQWLAKSELWTRWHACESEPDAARVFGLGRILTHDWLYAFVFYLEARTLIDGPDAAEAARDRLMARARERRQAAIARADALRQDRLAKAEAAWQRAVEQAGNDPLPWIQRGHWYADRGEQEKADRDFARARELAPEHPLWRLARERLGRTTARVWDFSRGAEGWTTSEHCRQTEANGMLAIDSTDPDPYVFTTAVKAPAGRHEVTICARVSGTLSSQLFWQMSQSTWSEANSVRFTIEGSGEWREYRVPFTASAEVTGLRFDPADNPTGVEIHAELSWILLSGYATEADWQRAVEGAGNDPLPWIQRGRWYAERGEREKAEADFAKAASLTPDELNKFLAAGWWIVGPYPGSLGELCPPELNPDPSEPVYAIHPQNGLSAEPVPWRSVLGDAVGRVDLSGNLAGPPGTTIYALAYVFAPDDRSVLLGMNGAWDANDPEHRVWINGEPAVPVRFTSVATTLKTHYPLALRAGLNTLLIKTPVLEQQPGFTARLGDHPVERGLQMGRFGLFDIAAREVDSGCTSVAEWRHYPRTIAAQFALLAGDRERFEQIARDCYENARQVNAAQTIHTSWALGQAPVNGIDPRPLSEWGDRWRNAENPPDDHYGWRMFALAKYRVGEFQQALDVLERPALRGNPHCQPILALTMYRLGRVEEARVQLDQAYGWFTQTLEQYRDDGMDYLWDFYPTFREAYELVHGNTTDVDARLTEFLESRRRLWEQRDPLISAYDDAVRNAPDDANAHVARGRRWTQLRRFDEAEADFNRAVELAPADIDVLLARARFHAERGSTEDAATAFGAALELVSEPIGEHYVSGLQIARELANHEAVFARTAELWPDDYRIWLGRGMWHADHARWSQAAEDYSKADWPLNFFILRTMERACLEWLAGDLDGYRGTCQGLIDRESGELTFQVRRGIVVACGIAPEASLPVPQLLERAEQLADRDRDRWVHIGLALALYRAGRFDEARLRCEAPRPAAPLDDRLALQAIRAMCLHKLGQSAESRQLLEGVQACLDAAHGIGRPGVSLAKNGAPEYTMRLISHVLYEQARQLLNAGATTPDNPPAAPE